MDTGSGRKHVLVTGFLDWPQPGESVEGFNRWRCRDNPSGRLLLETAHDARVKPVAGDGPLCRELRRAAPGMDWRFEVLPVAWGAVEELPLDRFEVVIGLGLGVYDDPPRVLVERGAANLRRPSLDVDGRLPGAPGAPPVVIDRDGSNVMTATAEQCRRMSAAIAVSGQFADWQLLTVDARDDNSYVCNESHYLVCDALRRRQPPGNGFFLHLPQVNDEAALEQLARFLVQPILSLAGNGDTPA